jgi:tRNA G46 methylase TrmB
LERVVKRHRDTEWLQPLHAPTVDVFRSICDLLDDGETRGLVLDSGCGTGWSTERLARIYPDQIVVGIDRSAARLNKSGAKPGSGPDLGSGARRQGNRIMARAELATFWRLAEEAGWHPSVHHLLYPNPWPKPAHLKRRWHAHPVFPCLLGLGGALLMRTNWRGYAAEFALALKVSGCEGVQLESIDPAVPASLFERKYQASGHRLYQVSARPGSPGCGRRTSGNHSV